ncbi:unnamed protein product [Vitrella brassicaformis CCMP3155]|uniref:DUF4203 domain-containing protein n=1 Tax=Vitrella brassicaformis (strain CCMP3155) TaxID=1169540 RepID=A0A0G4H0G6_VITBC|nr:unnamed protein product [Vitrella brassicaformis CCMP3155]|eukprot:CEM36903.1 unnamed protein product [Vitrella brassicaformis CCMP3155]
MAAMAALSLLSVVVSDARMLARHSHYPLSPHPGAHTRSMLILSRQQQPTTNETHGAVPAAAEEEFAALPVHLIDRMYVTVQVLLYAFIIAFYLFMALTASSGDRRDLFVALTASLFAFFASLVVLVNVIPALSSVIGLAIATAVFIITAVVMAYQSDKLKPLVPVAIGIGLNWLHAATAILIPTKGLGLIGLVLPTLSCGFMLLSVGVFERESYDLISFFSLPTSFNLVGFKDGSLTLLWAAVFALGLYVHIKRERQHADALATLKARVLSDQPAAAT